jgi:murein L,D-transpeptidase YcbB/YkuD
MSTVATAALKGLAADWKKCYTSAKLSGIVGDAAHQREGGYHIGRRFQSGSNYSVVRPDDKGGPDDAAAAIDMTMNASDMRLCTNRLVAAHGSLSDPRRKYVNAFNGTINNKQAKRWDVYARSVGSATADHLWHVHLEVRRKYVNSATAMAAILSILKGESAAAYTARVAGKSAPASANAPAKSPSYPGAPVKKGAKGTAVKQIQVKVASPADGDFGPKTEAAVKAWQSKHGLVADGIVGPATWKKMFP